MNDTAPELIALVRAHRERLDAVHAAVERALANEIAQLGRTPVSALIVAGLLENYYTCLETIFLRISQHFENRLDPSRWHNDLLQKMTLEIEGVRPAAVSEAAFSPLFELLKFRHFKRYYFELQYDWERLDFLVAKTAPGSPPGHARPGAVRGVRGRSGPAVNGAHPPPVPRAGMLATVRNRRGVVAGVEPFDAESGRLHLVHLEYADDRAPAAERLLWELEPRRHMEEPNALPDPAHAGGPMDAADFDALLRAARWTALSPYLGLDPTDDDGRARREIVASPFHGGVRIESYQLVPLLKALRMPRVNLLIADDVGLGKTVEAGLILTELLLRRRIRRVLVLTPASLRRQWREELWEKFSLRFQVVDRHETERLRRRLGMDATPWRSFSRIVASFHYLRQPDVLERFLAACRTPEDSPHLPWDLLIVDECHHLMPSPLRRGQRSVPDAARAGAAVRAPAVPLRHAPQRPHPLVSRPPGDARPGALHPHQRDEPGHAGRVEESWSAG